MTIKRSAYDALYDNNWETRPVVVLHGADTCTWNELINFVNFMARSLGFRLSVRYRGSAAEYRRADDRARS